MLTHTHTCTHSHTHIHTHTHNQIEWWLKGWIGLIETTVQRWRQVLYWLAPGLIWDVIGVEVCCGLRCRIDFIWVFEDLENSVIRVIRVDVYLHVGVYGWAEYCCCCCGLRWQQNSNHGSMASWCDPCSQSIITVTISFQICRCRYRK